MVAVIQIITAGGFGVSLIFIACDAATEVKLILKSIVKELQNKINQTEYWDLQILDLQMNYFGDEISLVIRNDEDENWQITFALCARVEYETDAGWPDWRTGKKVKNMGIGQLGYYGQDITVEENKDLDGFYDISLDLSILTAKVTCKEIQVERIPCDETHFFWQSN